MKLTGAQIICEGLVKEGVEVIFGFPGGAVLPLYDTLARYPQLRHILVRHEQGAAHAADGYARATGKVGVCMATSGPGATNLVTGIANAHLDSSPVVAITGQVARAFIGKDAFQEIDISGITLPITKHNYLVLDVGSLARTVKEAFYLARTGRPGPVLIDLPRDVQIEQAEFNYPSKVDLPGYKPTLQGHPAQIKK
jgi:acetolactate synthase-1/2/3 large subunit